MSIVSIDINPGRKGGTGSLGLVELVAGEIASRLELRWSQSAGFAVEWTFAEAFIADRPLVAYGADYDLHALGRLLAEAGIAVPDLRISDAMLVLSDEVPLPGYHLQGVARDLPLYTPDELDAMRAECKRTRAEKWLLATAADDAEACARVVQFVARRRGVTVEQLVASRPSRRLMVALRS